MIDIYKPAKTTTYSIARTGCIVFLISVMTSLSAFAQGMGGMGGMGGGGMGRGMHNSQNNQTQTDATPPPPAHPNPFATDAAPADSLEARTGALEKFIFGSERKKQPIKTRVQRLEKKLVPYEHHKPDDDLNVRVDHLWSILANANKQSERPTAQ